jgi:hypothetical protein
MSLHIQTDVVNIILEYYAQMRDMKWAPFIEPKTGKLKWKVNKYSAKYDNMNKMLKHKKDNLPDDISFDIDIVRNDEIIDTYNTIGTSICLKIKHCVNNYQTIIPMSKLYIEFINDLGFKHSLFCSIAEGSTLRRFDYDVYQDGIIHSTLIDFTKFSSNGYSLVIEKY